MWLLFSQEYAEIKEQKSRLMMELEQEKNKLEEDIVKLNTNKVGLHMHSLEVVQW